MSVSTIVDLLDQLDALKREKVSLEQSLARQGAKESQGCLAGQVILVTGAGRGIGAAVAVIVAKAGASVAICARSLDQLDDVKAEVSKSLVAGARVFAAVCDVTDESSVAAFLPAAVSALGPISCLINNAGTGQGAKNGPMWEIPVGVFDTILSVNLRGVWLMTQAVLTAPGTGMLARNAGSILMMSSACGVMAVPTTSAYSCSKWGLEGLTRVLAKDLAGTAVRCNSVSPGRVVTESFPESIGMTSPLTVRQPADIRECLLHILQHPSMNGEYVHAGLWDAAQGIRVPGADPMAHVR
jgi:3-oxoacyl-[acyl-carrier protein] reductase